jgi:Ca2+-binding RTX toxin-like protein
MAVFLGTASNDFIFGLDSDDLIQAFEGEDTVYGFAGNDTIQGNSGNDVLLGNSGNDTIRAGFSDDLVFGGRGNDTLLGDRGDDTLVGNRGADYVQGGEGRDIFAIGPNSGGGSFQEADIISDFSNGEDIIGLSGGLTFRDLNIVQGSADNIGNTIIQNNFTGEYLAILQGVERGTIGIGNFEPFEPTFNLALPAVTISSAVTGVNVGTFTVTRTNTVGNLTVNYAIAGTALNGSDYNNIGTAVTIPEGQTSATITITTLDDALVEPTETVILDIIPSAAYNVGIPSSASLTILDSGTIGSGGGGGTPPSGGSGGSIGETPATSGPDLLNGTAGNNTIDGLAGNDTINGNAGDDSLLGNADNDILSGGDGNDTLLGGDGIDTLTGDAGNDSLIGGADNDSLSGGDGIDTLTGDAGNDSLIGGAGNDSLIGGDGDDSLIGGADNDTLIGGAGLDLLTGGAGIDTFVYNLPTEGSDTITDFVVADEIIRVSSAGFGGELVAGVLPETAFEPGAALTAATLADTRFVYNSTTGALYFDADGSVTGPNAVLIATLTGAPVLTAANIIVL